MQELKEPNMGVSEVLGGHASNPAEPRTVGETLFALGQQWTMSSDENRLKAQFEQKIRSNAVKDMGEMSGQVHPDILRQMMSAYIADRAAGKYNWNGAAIRSALNDYYGMVYMMYLALRRCHPDIQESTVEEMFRESPDNCATAFLWLVGNLNASKTSGAKKTNNQLATDQTFDSPTV